MERVDCVVIGAGVVGLAIARRLALAGREVLILEREAAFGTHTSARNSEVIHAGIYYPPGSLRGRLCVAGRDMLYRYLSERGLPHRRCGKLIVATDAAQVPALALLAQTAARNGAGTLQPLTRAEALALEPALDCQAALLSPLTGILDSHAFMLALLGDVEAAGGALILRSAVTSIGPRGEGIAVQTRDADGGAFTLLARSVVNAAGLWAPALAAATEGLPPRAVPRGWFARGTWFAAPGRAAFSRLIYPLPEPGGLGIHLTLDLGGGMRFGPDVEWIDAVDYTLSAARAPLFESAVRRYWPGLPPGSLAPVSCGVRPKLSGPGQAAADFRIDGADVHGVPGLINLFGIESPGLTSSLAIADHVAAMLG